MENIDDINIDYNPEEVEDIIKSKDKQREILALEREIKESLKNLEDDIKFYNIILKKKDLKNNNK